MTASFNARLLFKESLIVPIIIFSLITWVFPYVGRAAAQSNVPEKSLIFEIKSTTESDQNQILQQQIAFAKIDKQVSLVRNYLQSRNAPLAAYTEILLAQPDWKTILAISNAESNMGRHCYKNNCSGIFAGHALKAYATIPDWIVDLQNLLTKRYQGKTLDQMNGVYVVPRSANWGKATSSVYNDLQVIENQFSESAA